ncbi:reverse transcriptase family protein, partial [Flavobacteriales bacterium]|nr:reverse transcriptase family protein [Flavobacteriales bacterium]
IHAPCNGLKHVLRSLNLVLQSVYEPHKRATGFVPGKSVVDNAQFHVGQSHVLNLDLQDFFHSFDRNRVKMGFMRGPLGLRGDREPLAFLLACLCTHPFVVNGEQRVVLPQGAPTSPTVTNLLCETLDRRLNGLAKRFGLQYSRYADDITFSGGYHFLSAKDFNEELHRIIEADQSLVINPDKTRFQKASYRQEVTGLIVNEKVNVPRRYVKELRMWIYMWERYGKAKATSIFTRDYAQDKGHVNSPSPSLEKVIQGKLNYLRMVKGDESTTFKKLHQRYLALQEKHKLVSSTLEIWESDGINLAIQHMHNQHKRHGKN